MHRPPTPPLLPDRPVRWSHSAFLALALVLGGCRGCGASPTAEKKEDTEAQKAKVREERRNDYKASRDAMRTLRALRNRTPDAPEVEKDWAPDVANARDLVLENDREKAEEAYVALTSYRAENPEDPDGFFWSGRAKMVRAAKDAAIEQFESAAKLDDASVAAHRWAAFALSGRFRCEEGIVHLNRAVELEPDNPDIYVDRIVCALRTNDWKLIVADLERGCSAGDEALCSLVAPISSVAERRMSRGKGKKMRGGDGNAMNRRKLGSEGKGKGRPIIGGAGGPFIMGQGPGKVGKRKLDDADGTTSTEAPPEELPENPDGVEE
jgi:tetratricopeptide (TPR) repeat protein